MRITEELRMMNGFIAVGNSGGPYLEPLSQNQVQNKELQHVCSLNQFVLWDECGSVESTRGCGENTEEQITGLSGEGACSASDGSERPHFALEMLILVLKKRHGWLKTGVSDGFRCKS